MVLLVGIVLKTSEVVLDFVLLEKYDARAGLDRLRESGAMVYPIPKS